MPPGATWGAATAVVSSGAAVGRTEAGATRWELGTGAASLLDAGDPEWQTRAHDMALVGTDEIIVGSRIGSVDGEAQVEAVYWKNGTLQPSLPPLVPGQRAGAYAVGEDGAIAGFAHDQNLESHLVIWHGPEYEICDVGLGHVNAVAPSTQAGYVHVAGASAGREQLGKVWTVELASCGVTSSRSLDFPSELHDVNASGDAVGEGAMKGRHNAILWTAAGDLLMLPSQASGRDKDDVAHGMNADASLVVGMSGKTAVLWSRIDP
ncbi:MAG: hypothetical protein R3304_11190 [Longimicrobiales bacterium]|nr:hypothetical protein [Longimicrobiales bacterium]